MLSTRMKSILQARGGQTLRSCRFARMQSALVICWKVSALTMGFVDLLVARNPFFVFFGWEVAVAVGVQDCTRRTEGNFLARLPMSGGPPKSWILTGFSIINHPFWGPTPMINDEWWCLTKSFFWQPPVGAGQEGSEEKARLLPTVFFVYLGVRGCEKTCLYSNQWG